MQITAELDHLEGTDGRELADSEVNPISDKLLGSDATECEQTAECFAFSG